ncbi:hypothetical protein [Nocardia sp. NPDC004604]|uniref:hypothetical protein n=1 Tax=Nocardia sp. NPDC004604 TaxID=3157013 RepID=UPI0033BC454D
MSRLGQFASDGGFRRDQALRILLGEFAEARSLIDRVADDGEFVALVRADITGADATRGHADGGDEVVRPRGQAVSEQHSHRNCSRPGRSEVVSRLGAHGASTAVRTKSGGAHEQQATQFGPKSAVHRRCRAQASNQPLSPFIGLLERIGDRPIR